MTGPPGAVRCGALGVPSGVKRSTFLQSPLVWLDAQPHPPPLSHLRRRHGPPVLQGPPWQVLRADPRRLLLPRPRFDCARTQDTQVPLTTVPLAAPIMAPCETLGVLP